MQLLDEHELDPDLRGPVTLRDCETDERLDLELDRRSVAVYKSRLERLRNAVQQAVLAVAGTYCCVPAKDPKTMFRESLLLQGVVEAG